VGVWGRSRRLVEHGPSRAEEQAGGWEIPQPAEQQLCGPMEPGLALSAGYSFSKSWHGEAFPKLGVQSAEVSALPGALPQPSMSPASQQSPWLMELMRSAAVSQSPSWISF
jgi:hypothetical protein